MCTFSNVIQYMCGYSTTCLPQTLLCSYIHTQVPFQYGMLALVKVVVPFSWTTWCVREMRALYWTVLVMWPLESPTASTVKMLGSDAKVRIYVHTYIPIHTYMYTKYIRT